nr:integrase arm-type DNA-binding domain-containing protein [Limnohabitans sp. DM1]
MEVSPAGSKRWFWKTYQDGKEGRMALGSYPAVNVVEAGKARDAAKALKGEGVDPVQARKLEKLKASNPDGDTFKSVALGWFAVQEPGWSENHATRTRRNGSGPASPGHGGAGVQTPVAHGPTPIQEHYRGLEG